MFVLLKKRHVDIHIHRLYLEVLGVGNWMHQLRWFDPVGSVSGSHLENRQNAESLPSRRTSLSAPYAVSFEVSDTQERSNLRVGR